MSSVDLAKIFYYKFLYFSGIIDKKNLLLLGYKENDRGYFNKTLEYKYFLNIFDLKIDKTFYEKDLDCKFGSDEFFEKLNNYRFLNLYSSKERKNKIFWESALDFDHAAAVKSVELSTRIGYLSCDIEPPANTFAALQRVIEQGIHFDCITFEHDNYVQKKRGDLDYDIVAREYLLSKGYKVAVTDVYCKSPEFLFETWFVHNDIDFQTTTFDQWKKSNKL
jgi:hypothetical protein